MAGIILNKYQAPDQQPSLGPVQNFRSDQYVEENLSHQPHTISITFHPDFGSPTFMKGQGR